MLLRIITKSKKLEGFSVKIAAIFLTLILLTLPTAYATDKKGRLGIGMNNQLANDIPALSFKLQKSNAFAFGGIFGINTDDRSGGHGAGLKLYRIIFDEPQLDFYASAMGALLKQETSTGSESGFQVDLTLGSEFHFAGISSLGFSVEFGISLNKLDDFVIESVGSNFLVAGVHFYL